MKDTVVKYKISVVMAVYNAEPFLKEAIDSLIKQDIGFENIQLIMVNDGSTDDSGNICNIYKEKYPKNIIVIHKENGGVASARNEGLKYAQGKYLNFMDSDDIMQDDAFNKMFLFFEEHEYETDIVTIPLRFFDAASGEHWQNSKFKKGTRIIDLKKEPNNTLMFVNCSLFSSTLKEKIHFDSTLPCGEDIKVIYTLLLSKMTLGVVHDTQYWYRRRSIGEASLVATAHGKRSWYFDYFYNLQFWMLEYYKNEIGYIPKYVQYVFASETQWRFRKDSNNLVEKNILTEKELEEYKQLLRKSIQEIDDSILISEPFIYFEQKLFLLMFKYNVQKAQMIYYDNKILVGYNDCIVGSLSSVLLEVCLVTENHNILKIEGLVTLPSIECEFIIGYKVKDEFFPQNWLDLEIEEKVLDTTILIKKSFCIEIDLNTIDRDLYIKFALMVNDKYFDLTNLKYHPTSPITKQNSNMYFSANEYIVYAEKWWISIVKAGSKVRKKKRQNFLKELWKNKKEQQLAKAFVVRLLLSFLLKIKNKPVWLITDRYTKAGDNGEALFKYLQDKSNIDSYFILFNTSEDYERLKNIGKVIEPYSWKHKILHLIADAIISSHADDFIINPFRGCSAPYQDLLATKKFAFLQHGIINADLSLLYNRLKIHAKMFVTSAYPEYNSICNGKYLYSNNEVCLTGLPRYDLLLDKSEKIISIMPTWRSYLVEDCGDGSGNRRAKKDFKKSIYFKMYSEVLMNPKLLIAVKKYGYQVQWVSHPNMKDTMKEFCLDESIKTIVLNLDYKEIFAQSSIIVTDYSSVAFDFAYLRKPVVYFQQDKEEFFAGHTYTKGYFDYEKDGFGEVCFDVDTLVNLIIEYMENDCKLKDKYRERIDGFFAYNDRNNCQRVYEKILELE